MASSATRNPPSCLAVMVMRGFGTGMRVSSATVVRIMLFMPLVVSLRVSFVSFMSFMSTVSLFQMIMAVGVLFCLLMMPVMLPVYVTHPHGTPRVHDRSGTSGTTASVAVTKAAFAATQQQGQCKQHW